MHPEVRLLQSPSTFATTLLGFAVDRLVDDTTPLDEVMHWHPSTLRMELETETGAKIPAINVQKLTAAIDIVTSDSFFRRPSVFTQYCLVLNDEPMTFGTVAVPDAQQSAWGIVEAMLLAQPDEDEPFDEEILWYLGGVLKEEGIREPPDVLRIAKFDPDYSDMPTDDPMMFEAIYLHQKEGADEIEQAIRSRLRRLIMELSGAPWRHAQSGFAKRLVEGFA